jgi:hypothetical protein
MAITKTIKTDKIEAIAIQDHYHLQVRERISIQEDGNEISSSHTRYILTPDSVVSDITDEVVKAQFIAIMTDEVKTAYTTFLKDNSDSRPV